MNWYTTENQYVNVTINGNTVKSPNVNQVVTPLTSSLLSLPAASIVGGTGSFDLAVIPANQVFFDADIILNFPNRHSNTSSSESKYVTTTSIITCTKGASSYTTAVSDNQIVIKNVVVGATVSTYLSAATTYTFSCSGTGFKYPISQ